MPDDDAPYTPIEVLDLLREYGRHAEGCSGLFRDAGGHGFVYECKCGWRDVARRLGLREDR